MFKTKVGYSQNPDACASGAESAAMAQLADAKVGLLFTSCVLDQEAVVNRKYKMRYSGSHVYG